MSVSTWSFLNVFRLNKLKMLSDGSGKNAMPNCTWYVYYRAYTEFGSFPVTSLSGAAGWVSIPNTKDHWKTYWDSNWVPGDVLVYSDGHVAFVEGNGQISESALTYYCNSNGSKHYLNRSGTCHDLYQDAHNHWEDQAYSIHSPDSISSTVGSRFWSINPTVRWGTRYSGRIHQELNSGGGSYDPPDPGGGGGGGDVPDPPEPGQAGWVLSGTGQLTYQETVCGSPADTAGAGTQMWPRIPTVYSQEEEDREKAEWEANPGPASEAPHWRTNRQWSPFIAYTYERYMTYEKNSSGIYVGKWSDWQKINEKTHSGDIAGYDTGIDGPLDGWDFEWNDIHGDG